MLNGRYQYLYLYLLSEQSISDCVWVWEVTSIYKWLLHTSQYLHSSADLVSHHVQLLQLQCQSDVVVDQSRHTIISLKKILSDFNNFARKCIMNKKKNIYNPKKWITFLLLEEVSEKRCECITGISGIPSIPSLLGSINIEAMANPINTRAPMKVMTLADMNLATIIPTSTAAPVHTVCPRHPPDKNFIFPYYRFSFWVISENERTKFLN